MPSSPALLQTPRPAEVAGTSSVGWRHRLKNLISSTCSSQNPTHLPRHPTGTRTTNTDGKLEKPPGRLHTRLSEPLPKWWHLQGPPPASSRVPHPRVGPAKPNREGQNQGRPTSHCICRSGHVATCHTLGRSATVTLLFQIRAGSPRRRALPWAQGSASVPLTPVTSHQHTPCDFLQTQSALSTAVHKQGGEPQCLHLRGTQCSP